MDLLRFINVTELPSQRQPKYNFYDAFVLHHFLRVMAQRVRWWDLYLMDGASQEADCTHHPTSSWSLVGPFKVFSIGFIMIFSSMLARIWAANTFGSLLFSSKIRLFRSFQMDYVKCGINKFHHFFHPFQCWGVPLFD